MLPPGLAPPPGAGHATPQQVALIAHLLHGSNGPGAGPAAGPPPDENGKGLSPLEAVQSVIEDLHQLAKIVPDPQAVKTVTTCLNAMAGLQAQMMQQKGGQ